MKKNNKGFTLVELIVVLVILAILAAILVPALLGYIDKARQKQTTTNAEAAYVAAQALATEYYGKDTTPTKSERDAAVTAAEIQELTDITENFSVKIGYKSNDAADGKKICVVSAFTYQDSKGNQAVWNAADGSWEVKQASETTALSGDDVTSYTASNGGGNGGN